MRVEAFGDVFNLFNALNPGYSTTSTNRRLINPTTGAADPTLLQPNSFAGDTNVPSSVSARSGSGSRSDGTDAVAISFQLSAHRGRLPAPPFFVC